MSDEANAVNETVAEPVVDAVVDAPAALVKPGNIGGKIVFGSAIAALLFGLFGPVGSGLGLWHWQTGFLAIAIAMGLAFFAILLGFGLGWWNKRKGKNAPKLLRWAGMAIAIGYAGWMLSIVYTARTVPAIHDISTDLADPPQFRMLELRKDNLDMVPGEDDPEMKGMNPQQRWVLVHQKAYGDIRSVRINMPVAEAIAKAERLAKIRDWEIVLADPIEGRMEATETSALFGFKDDVVLRVRPTEDGTGSIVDMRSVSRVGQSDLGVNAKRVRSFLADLSGTVTAG